MADAKVVLITGCSTGIGRSTAELLAERGHKVYATARKTADIEDLKAKGCETLALDVCDEGSMAAAVNHVESAEGAIGALVNNAGYSQSGAVETVPMDDVRRQFETNVFGLMRMCQLVLPKMRAAGWGRIVNISSIGGKVVFPGGGVYHGTKHAVEALSDALRWETREFGVDVVIIEPGLIKTEFANRVVSEMDVVDQGSGDYGRFNAAVAKLTSEAYDGPFGKLGGGPETVAVKVARAIEAGRPRTRYSVTPSAKLILFNRKLMTDRMWDAFTGTQYPKVKP